MASSRCIPREAAGGEAGAVSTHPEPGEKVSGDVWEAGKMPGWPSVPF